MAKIGERCGYGGLVVWAAVPALALLAGLSGCADNAGRERAGSAQSCMKCHNGSSEDDYAGPGMEDPHPFPGAANLQCTVCHGGNGQGGDKEGSHVPPPPEIGDRANWVNDREAYFNRLTLAGIDKYPDYQVGNRTYTALDYLQFVNPSDLRVVTQNRSCGTCHANHADVVSGSLLATEAGVLSGARFAAGIDHAIPAHQNLFEETAASLAFRAVEDTGYVLDPSMVGRVANLLEYPVYSSRANGPIFRNNDYDALALINDLLADNRVVTDSKLAHLYNEQVAFTCGDCHLGSAGANNRYGDFRPSGCAACHMRHSLSGRSLSGDPNIPRDEPRDPDDIDPPELSHLRRHRISSVARTLSNGIQVEGIDDYACAGCHQGSNRTVMQYWGIRLDQNQDLRRRVQYPANPVSFTNTSQDTRLFDPEVNNRTFNGRNANQYILTEDYDGDGRDDTPADVHHEAGLGCIDCHGSSDLHGGDVNDPDGKRVRSRMSQAVSIQCESCHGGIESYAATTQGTAYDGTAAELATDANGQALRHVVKEGEHYYLYSRLTGRRHYVIQTKDTVDNNGRLNPLTQQPLYSAKASYAMGRYDTDDSNGTGPNQDRGCTVGFAHGDTMSCASCHAAWTNTCMGCHLEGEYNTGNNFSNITGERIAFREKFAEFVYQSPVPFQLGVDAHNKISQVSPNTKVFFRYEDFENKRSQVFAFSDRQGKGNNPSAAFRAMGHNAMMAHSIRGKVTPQNEGPRYCTSCHLTDNSMRFRTEYDAFKSAMRDGRWADLDFDLLKEHIGQNPGNQLDSPIWVHMVAGLGSGLFLFDKDGCPTNPLDIDDDRYGCEGNAPANNFDAANVVYNLDRLVEENGAANSSSNIPLIAPGIGTNLRQGAANPNLAGPLGSILIRRLTDPDAVDVILLDSWIDADGVLRGNAGNHVR